MLVAWNYRYRNSPMDHIDPRARLIFSFAYLFAVSASWDPTILAVLFVIALIWYAMSGVTWKESKRGWMMISVLLFTMIVVNTIITGGGAGGVVKEGGQLVWPEGFSLFGHHLRFGLTVERLWFAVAQLMRILGISLVFVLLPYTMDSRAYGVTFSKLGLPDRLAYTMELSFRFIPTLARSFQVTLEAQQARGFEMGGAKGGLIRKIRGVAPLLIPVTMSAIVSSEDIANAMDLRGFGQRKRSWYYQLHYRAWDYALIVFSVLVLGTVLVLVYRFGMKDFVVPGWWYSFFG